MRSVAWLAYDDDFFYAAFEFDEPDPQTIRAPLGDRDNVRSYTDYGGVILDSQNDGHTAQLFLANARGIQYDALSNDASGEDDSPDYFWDSAAKITATGWVLEIRIPFSSLRYTDPDPAQWGILLYRNRPRDFRYQMFTSRLPRDSSCFICNSRPLVGLAGLSVGSHYVVAPYVAANQSAAPRDGLGSPLATDDAEFDGGVDAKWIPNPSTAIDATVNPDFSQIESDAGQITANERFALFYPEKRPFFLEGVNLLSTPIQAVYTRTFTSPRFGLRATGGTESNKYTALFGQDRGGGSVILPGPEGSGFADQDFSSYVAITRARHDFKKAFVSLLYTGRENEAADGGGFNHVAGPDFEWRPTPQDTVTGQILYSWTETPNRPELAAEWDGRKLEGHAAKLWAQHATETWDLFGSTRTSRTTSAPTTASCRRSATGCSTSRSGRTWHPVEKKVVAPPSVRDRRPRRDPERRAPVPGVRTWIRPGRHLELVRALRVRLRRGGQPGAHLRALPVPAAHRNPPRQDRAAGDPPGGLRRRRRLRQQPPRRRLADDAHRRPPAHRPSRAGALGGAPRARRRHRSSRAWRSPAASSPPTSRELRVVYTFNAKSWLRLIGEWAETERDPALYTFDVRPTSADFAGSAVFAYKLNWQTVFFLGVGDERTQDPNGDLQPLGRQAFFKISYAFQR